MKIFVEELWSWYARHKRQLPWRDLAIKDDTERAYRILVSEVMLQQTQVSRVQIVYKQFLERFPSIKNLAQASNKDVILAWRGMGYNSRALRLRDACKVVMGEHRGQFPREMEELLAIKGIGPYTAAAIRNFAFNIPTPCLDTNIRRIYHRTFFGPENPDGSWPVDDEKLMKIAEQVLEIAVSGFDIWDSEFDIRNSTLEIRYSDNQIRGRRISTNRSTETECRIPNPESRTSSEWHAALMDFGSLVCTKVNPKWDQCPLTRRGIMKAAYKVKLDRGRGLSRISKEPGRSEGGRHVPNRIYRGRVVEALRDAPKGLRLEEIGPRVCLDWNEEDRAWLQKLIKKLIQDGMLEGAKKFTLKS